MVIQAVSRHPSPSPHPSQQQLTGDPGTQASCIIHIQPSHHPLPYQQICKSTHSMLTHFVSGTHLTSQMEIFNNYAQIIQSWQRWHYPTERMPEKQFHYEGTLQYSISRSLLRDKFDIISVPEWHKSTTGCWKHFQMTCSDNTIVK